MFATYEVTVEARFEIAAVRLTNFVKRGALRAASEAAYEGSMDMDMGLRVGPFGEVRGLSKLVSVRFAELARRDGSLTVPLRWEAAGMAGELFPMLDADLTLTDGGDNRTRVRLDGSYRPPLGRAGAMLDRAAMGRLAMATIRSLVETVADAVADPAPELEPGREAAPPWWPASEFGEP